MTEAKPCPFCGKTGKIDHYPAVGDDIPAVSAITHPDRQCPAYGFHSLTKWNQRFEPSEAFKTLISDLLVLVEDNQSDDHPRRHQIVERAYSTLDTLYAAEEDLVREKPKGDNPDS